MQQIFSIFIIVEEEEEEKKRPNLIVRKKERIGSSNEMRVHIHTHKVSASPAYGVRSRRRTFFFLLIFFYVCAHSCARLTLMQSFLSLSLSLSPLFFVPLYSLLLSYTYA